MIFIGQIGKTTHESITRELKAQINLYFQLFRMNNFDLSPIISYLFLITCRYSLVYKWPSNLYFFTMDQWYASFQCVLCVMSLYFRLILCKNDIINELFQVISPSWSGKQQRTSVLVSPTVFTALLRWQTTNQQVTSRTLGTSIGTCSRWLAGWPPSVPEKGVIHRHRHRRRHQMTKERSHRVCIVTSSFLMHAL